MMQSLSWLDIVREEKGRINHLEDAVVENDHDKAGDVEGAQGGPDDEVRVIESTYQRF